MTDPLSQDLSVASLLFYSFFAFGIAYGLGFSKAAYATWLRFLAVEEAETWPALGKAFFAALLTCPMCCGFWTGVLSGAILGLSRGQIFMLAFYTAGSNLYLARRTELIPRPEE